MTEKLYYQDATLRTFTACIVDRLTHAGQPAVVLDRTAFYPTGGGQPNDRGKLGEALVVDVIERGAPADGEVLHILSQDITSDEVVGEIDWPRRFDLMQQHTGQHILSEAFIKAADAETIGFHLTDDNLTIDLNKRNLDQADVDRAENLANQIVFEDRPVIPCFVNAEELAQMPLRKPPKVETNIRIVQVEGFDWSPCGGTHVARTGQVGLIKVVKLERRSDALRVEFHCGGRALADYARKHQVLQEVAGGLSISFTELGQAIAKMQVEGKELYKKLAEAESKLLLYQVAELDATAEERDQFRLITSAWTDRDAASLRTLAKKLVGKPRTVVLLGSSGRQPMLVFARSTDVELDLVPLLRGAIERIGGKGGGGKPDFCQGGSPPASERQVRTAIEWVASQLADR